MAEVLLDGRGEGHLVGVTSDNRLLVDISGATINIGSVSAQVDSIYVQSGANMTGSMYRMEDVPTSTIYNNPALKLEYIISGTATGVTGSEIGSIIKYIGAGSFVQVITYSNDLITNVGSWT